ncbi:MAG: hypothetical protein EF812_06455 [Methanosarcinales archaeon]|nr:MAG: hypothetical protein EF812_06455 [Methanosarcinales archaeon]
MVKINIKMKSVGLDRYYSSSSCVDKFGDAKVSSYPEKMSLYMDHGNGRILIHNHDILWRYL